MISMADLQALFGKVEGSTVAVDLLKVGQQACAGNSNNVVAKHKVHPKFRLALDIEDCLDRFYGGYYSDWACGGQWNRAFQFVQLLVEAFEVAKIEVIVFFDGSLRDRRRGHHADAKETRQKIVSVLKHIRMIGTPPPKIWWLPPSGTRTAIRNALRFLHVQVVQTVNDHTREVIDYYREHKLNGIIGLHPDYIVAQPTHYYSSHDLRLSYKSTLETKEYVVAKLLTHLDVTRAQLPFVAAFIGTQVPTSSVEQIGADTMRKIYAAIGVEFATDFETRCKALAKVVASAPIGDVDAFIKHLKLDEWATILREAIEYYQRRERLIKVGGKYQQQQPQKQQQQQQSQQEKQPKSSRQKRGKGKGAAGGNSSANSAAATSTSTVAATNVIDDPTASPKTIDDKAVAADLSIDLSSDNELSNSALAASTALASETTDLDDEFQRKLESDVNNLVDELDYELESMTLKEADSDALDEADTDPKPTADDKDGIATAGIQPKSTAATVLPKSTQPTGGRPAAGTRPEKSFVYTLPSDVIKTAYNRHRRGMMDARLYQLLTKKEIVLPQALEDEQFREVPSVHLFYRPARQMIYAIMFNLNHQKYIHSKHPKNSSSQTAKNQPTQVPASTTTTTATPQVPNATTSAASLVTTVTATNQTPQIAIQEWLWSPQNEYKRAETVYATQLGWAVPTIQRLWFGTLFEDKQRRMKAFLSVMRSDAPLMLNRDYVPHHMLAMACVLRYMVTHPERTILSRAELDTFLATAFSPHIMNIEYTQELVLPCVFLRGVFLGTLFMQGVETASMANDACGVPLRWTLCNPWLFFDGKLFHLKLKAASYVQSLRELCDEQIDVVLKIERFRKAILEDVEHYLMPPIGNNHAGVNNKSPYFNAGLAANVQVPYFGGNMHAASVAAAVAASAPHHNLNSMDRRRNAQDQLVRQLRQQRQQQNGDYPMKLGGAVLNSYNKPYNNSGAGGMLRHHQQNQHQYHQQQQQYHHHHNNHHHQHHPAQQNYDQYGAGDSYNNHHHHHNQNNSHNNNHQHHHQHNQPHHHPHRPRGNGLNASVFYNNMVNRRRRQNPDGAYVNNGGGGGGGGIASGAGGIARRTIGRKNIGGGPLGGGGGGGGAGAGGGGAGGGSGLSAEAKLAKNKARKQRAKNNKQTAAATTTAVAAAATATTATTVTTEEAPNAEASSSNSAAAAAAPASSPAVDAPAPTAAPVVPAAIAEEKTTTTAVKSDVSVEQAIAESTAIANPKASASPSTEDAV